jgi:hypothetical protein
MPRYKLRTLLILLAVGPPLIWAVINLASIAHWFSNFLATEVYYGGCIEPNSCKPMV